MARIKKARRWYFYATSPLSLLILATVLFFSGRAVWSHYEQNRVSAAAREAAEAELGHLQARIAELESSIKSWETPRGQEELVREHLPVARPGEKVLKIVGGNQN